MAGPKTDLKDALEQSGGKLPPPEPKEMDMRPLWFVSRVSLELGKNLLRCIMISRHICS